MDKSFEDEFKKISIMLEKTNSDGSTSAKSNKQYFSAPQRPIDYALKNKQTKIVVLGLRSLNGALGLVILGLMAYMLVYAFVLSKSDYQMPVVENVAADTFVYATTWYVQPLDSYLAPVNERSIFQPFEDIQPVAIVADAQAVVVAASELLAKYRIVGIMIDAQSTVILEDTTLQQTLFLSQGDQFNGITVEAINEENVQFNYKGQIVILSP